MFVFMPPKLSIGLTLKPGRVGGHDDDRDALVLLHLGVGAHREPDVVGVGREAREDLLAVDHVLVAVADGARLQRREVGAGVGLGVADREVDLAGEDLRDVELLLLLVPKRMIVGATELIVSIGTGAPGAHRLVEEHELLDRA